MNAFSNLNSIGTIAIATLLLALTGCSVGEHNQEGAKFPATDASMRTKAQPNIRQQMKAVKTYAKTVFRLIAIEEAQLAGLDMQARGTGSALAPAQASQLAAATSQGASVPLHMRLRLEAKNPNREKVVLNQLEYLVLVDNREVASGTTEAALEIGPRSTLAIPLTIDANMRESLAAGLKAEALANALTTWNQKPARLVVRVRPTFQNEAGRAFRTTNFEPIEASAISK